MRPTHSARLVALGSADGPDTFVTRALPELALRLGGIEGDRHFGLTMKAGVRQAHHPRGAEVMNTRQLSLVSVEELAEIARTLGVSGIEWQKLGANLVLEG